MQRLFFIDDEPENIRPAVKRVEEEWVGIICKTSDSFTNAQSELGVFLPDVVILDLLQGPQSVHKPEGLETLNAIWEKRFFPIVIYSAEPDHVHEDQRNHPFVRSVKKGKDSPDQIVAALKELQPHIRAIRDAESQIRDQFAFVLRDIAPFAFSKYTDENHDERIDTIVRCGRRRLAALMDELPGSDQKLASWEQYLFPPVGSDSLTGDIIHEDGKDQYSPESYRIILTPSCDMATSGNRTPKITQVLVAHCCTIEEGLKRLSLAPSTDFIKFIKRLESELLSQGYKGSVIPLSGLKGLIPSMMVDLKNIGLVPLSEIGLRKTKFIRRASIDSPFREMMVWAYMQNACRPGLPERDLTAWGREIFDQVKPT